MDFIVTFGVLVFVLGTVASHQHMTREAWTIGINAYFLDHVESYNAQDMIGIEARMSTDIHRMPPGKHIQIGLAEVMDGYKTQLDSGYWPTLMEMELTDLRMYTDTAAVAEWHGSTNSTYGVSNFKGLGVFVIEDQAVKVSTNIYNSDPA